LQIIDASTDNLKQARIFLNNPWNSATSSMIFFSRLGFIDYPTGLHRGSNEPIGTPAPWSWTTGSGVGQAKVCYFLTLLNGNPSDNEIAQALDFGPLAKALILLGRDVSFNAWAPLRLSLARRGCDSFCHRDSWLRRPWFGWALWHWSCMW
jgi:hypothetical protein